MKYPDYLMKIMAGWITRDELECTRTRRYFIDRSGINDTKQFTYQQQFGINFRYRHQVYNQNNHRRAPIFLERT